GEEVGERSLLGPGRLAAEQRVAGGFARLGRDPIRSRRDDDAGLLEQLSRGCGDAGDFLRPEPLLARERQRRIGRVDPTAGEGVEAAREAKLLAAADPEDLDPLRFFAVQED